MPDFDVVSLKTVLGRLRSFQQNLPAHWSSFPDRYGDEYSDILASLVRAGVAVSQELELPSTAVRRRPLITNAETQERAWSDPEIDRTALLSRVGGAIAFIEGLLEDGESKPPDPAAARFGSITISGGHVTFGDGSHINITTVTVGDLLKALQSHVEATVADPATKESVLTQIGNVLKHPASTAVLQVGLPELLKRLLGA